MSTAFKPATLHLVTKECGATRSLVLTPAEPSLPPSSARLKLFVLYMCCKPILSKEICQAATQTGGGPRNSRLQIHSSSSNMDEMTSRLNTLSKTKSTAESTSSDDRLLFERRSAVSDVKTACRMVKQACQFSSELCLSMPENCHTGMAARRMTAQRHQSTSLTLLPMTLRLVRAAREAEAQTAAAASLEKVSRSAPETLLKMPPCGSSTSATQATANPICSGKRGQIRYGV